MIHELAVRANKADKKEVKVQLNLPDSFDKAKVTESLVACAFRHIILLCILSFTFWKFTFPLEAPALHRIPVLRSTYLVGL